mgnify:CR=1 FL=1
MQRDRFGVEPVCAVLEFPVSSYYYAVRRASEPTARETRDAILKDKIMEVWKGRKGREVYGARKVWLELNRQGIPVARCTVERLMRDLGIGGVQASWTGPELLAEITTQTAGPLSLTSLRRILAGHPVKP